VDGRGSAAGFNYPQGIAVDQSGNAFVADDFNQRVRVVTPAGGTLRCKRVGLTHMCWFLCAVV
jgi:hypothetical protein